jgi:hypothetical protein
MGNSLCKSLKQLCYNFNIRSTCVSACCSDNIIANNRQEIVLTPIEIPPQHAHHIEHHEHIENIGGVLHSNVILHTIEDKIVCD